MGYYIHVEKSYDDKEVLTTYIIRLMLTGFVWPTSTLNLNSKISQATYPN